MTCYNTTVNNCPTLYLNHILILFHYIDQLGSSQRTCFTACLKIVIYVPVRVPSLSSNAIIKSYVEIKYRIPSIRLLSIVTIVTLLFKKKFNPVGVRCCRRSSVLVCFGPLTATLGSLFLFVFLLTYFHCLPIVFFCRLAFFRLLVCLFYLF